MPRRTSNVCQLRAVVCDASTFHATDTSILVTSIGDGISLWMLMLSVNKQASTEH